MSQEQLEKRSESAQKELDKRLHDAICHRSPLEVAEALEAGADVCREKYSRDWGREYKNGTTPMHLALRTRHADINCLAIIDLLYVAGARLRKPQINSIITPDADKSSKIPWYARERKIPAHYRDGLKHLRDLEAGTHVATPKTIFENYGIQFDLGTHIRNVALSPFPQQTYAKGHYVPKTNPEKYRDIEALGRRKIPAKDFSIPQNSIEVPSRDLTYLRDPASSGIVL
jgi:hypothetical protein